jgi:hypothetical protein
MSNPNAKAMLSADAIPAVSVTYAQDGTSTSANALGMRPMNAPTRNAANSTS